VQREQFGLDPLLPGSMLEGHRLQPLGAMCRDPRSSGQPRPATWETSTCRLCCV
jgi:hypothetical protein